MKCFFIGIALIGMVLSDPIPVRKPLATFSQPTWTIGQLGTASWYGDPFHGRLTANGEIYNMHELTAAHRALPFGTQLQVTNLKNDRSVTLRVNDRGPYIPGRFLDVSFGAAAQLNFVNSGLADVRVEIIQPLSHRKTRHPLGYWLRQPILPVPWEKLPQLTVHKNSTQPKATHPPQVL